MLGGKVKYEKIFIEAYEQNWGYLVELFGPSLLIKAAEQNEG